MWQPGATHLYLTNFWEWSEFKRRGLGEGVRPGYIFLSGFTVVPGNEKILFKHKWASSFRCISFGEEMAFVDDAKRKLFLALSKQSSIYSVTLRKLSADSIRVEKLVFKSPISSCLTSLHFIEVKFQQQSAVWLTKGLQRTDV